MDCSVTGLELIESFEGYSFNAYWDAFGHVWTVGYGETEGVNSGTTMSRAQAQLDLSGRLTREYEPAINALGVALNQNQYDALCSFVWNLGAGAMEWDVGRDIRAGNFLSAGNAMLQYDHAGGVALAGLTRRRQEERALFLRPPPPPPDPHHYLYYPAASFDFAGPFAVKIGPDVHKVGAQRWNERATVESYDRLRPGWKHNQVELDRLRVGLARLAARVDAVARRSNPPAWQDDRRLLWRHHRLQVRANGGVSTP